MASEPKGHYFSSPHLSSSPGFVKVPQGNNYIVISKIAHLPIHLPPSCADRRKYFQPRPAELKKDLRRFAAGSLMFFEAKISKSVGLCDDWARGFGEN